ncbi:hypothetical protein [Halomarina rubra]|uniref:Tripartite tricarboxylate transporter TctB family protein n=1 Tax=Halomarina rubra TaxID=2071873 RepID=A0ABD6AUC5_9EURY|nr:hypothetical protein [Halomarina rubra]
MLGRGLLLGGGCIYVVSGVAVTVAERLERRLTPTGATLVATVGFVTALVVRVLSFTAGRPGLPPSGVQFDDLAFGGPLIPILAVVATSVVFAVLSSPTLRLGVAMLASIPFVYPIVTADQRGLEAIGVVYFSGVFFGMAVLMSVPVYLTVSAQRVSSDPPRRETAG